MRRITATLAWMAVLGLALKAHAAPAAFEQFDYPDGSVADRGVVESDGWAGPWEGSLAVRDRVLEGQGQATRSMIPRVDFQLDAEWYFRITIARPGPTPGGSDFAVLRLVNRDRAVDNTPLFIGINSTEKFYAGAGVPQREATLFGEAKPDHAYTMVGRLTTRFEGPDELRVWVFPAERPLPSVPPNTPDLVQTLDYSKFAEAVVLATGTADGYFARFDDLLIANSWADVIIERPESFTFLHQYQRLRPVRVAEDGVHMLPNLWGNMSVVRWDAGNTWQLFYSSSLAWLPRSSVLYTPLAPGLRAAAMPAPDPALPLFDSGRDFDALPPGNYQSVLRSDGRGYDLVRFDDMTYIPITRGADGAAEPGEAYPLLERPLDGEGAHHFVADVDGDGVADLLTGRLRESKWNYWPERGSPWQRPRQALMGPDRDAEVNGNLRGYDIAGNWLGSPVSFELVWARGELIDGRLTFGDVRTVYQGRDDFPLLWRNHSQMLAAGVIVRQEQRYVILMSALNQVLASPILDTGDRELHLGKAVPLLAPDADLYSLNMDAIRAVVDLDDDGVTEIIVASGSSGHVTVLKGDAIGTFRTHVVHKVGGPLAGATLITPARGDWDGDGYPDIVIGDGQGLFTCFPGTADPLVYRGGALLKDAQARVIRYSGERNIQGDQERAWGYTQAELFDWDRDGQLDLIANDSSATLRLLRRIDPADASRVGDAMMFTLDGHKLPVAWRSRPAAIDGAYRVAGDERPVLLYLDTDQQIAIGVPESVGSGVIERVIRPTYRDGEPITLAWWGGLSGRTMFAITDWDEDGVWDLLLTSQYDNVNRFYKHPQETRESAYIRSCSPFWLRNVGSNDQPVFERARRIRHADGRIIRVETHAANIYPTDLDGDGKALDLLFGDGPGLLYYFMRDELSWDDEPSR